MCFNEKEDAELFQPRTPFIMHVTPQTFEIPKEDKEKPAIKGGKKDKKADAVAEKPVEKPAEKIVEQPKPAYNFAAKLDEQYRK